MGAVSRCAMATQTPLPFPGLPVRAPRRAPQPGEVVVRYELVAGKSGCCECGDLKPEGWIVVIILLLFCFPFAWVPCCIKSLHEPHQVPVYGPPSALVSAPPQQTMPVAAPVSAPPAMQVQGVVQGYPMA